MIEPAQTISSASETAMPVRRNRGSGLRFMRGLLWFLDRLRSRPVVRQRTIDFERTKVRCLTRVPIGHIRQNDTAVDSCRARFEPEVEILGFVDHLDLFEILGVESRNVDERVVIELHAVRILLGGFAVLLKRRKPAALERPAAAAREEPRIVCWNAGL